MPSNELINELTIKNIQLELDIKTAELLSKQREIDNCKNNKPKLTLEKATIFVAIIGFLGSFLGNTMQGYFSLQQKQQEFEAGLITNAVDAGDSSVSRRNLKFLIDAGLIKDKNGKIDIIVRDSSYKLPEFNISNSISYNNTILRNPGSSKYHLSNCRLISSQSMRINAVDIKELNLVPCKICNPSQIYKLENQVQCQAYTKRGIRCKHMTAFEYCFQHRPRD